MKAIHSILLRGLLGASITAFAGCGGCGSDGEQAACSGSCAGADASSGDASSGNGGTDGAAGSDGSAGAGGTGAGGTTGGAGGVGNDGSAGNDAGVDVAADAAACGACSAYTQPVRAGTVAQAELMELSGIVASRRHPGVFFAHNDSGDSARFFAFDEGGRTLGEFRLQGVSAADWEDMALGPCPAGSCLFFGDIGDNSHQRASVAIVRVSEPEVTPGADAGTVVVAHDRFEYRYAAGPQNAEALLADPGTGHLYIVTKNPSGTSLVFRIDAPQSPGPVQTLSTLRELALPAPGGRLVTGGAAHPCGDRLLLRTYDALLEYVAPPGQTFEAAFAATARPVPVAVEPQGEAVTYLADGAGYMTASEGTAPALNVARCQ